jgi:hypothetical protein
MIKPAVFIRHIYLPSFHPTKSSLKSKIFYNLPTSAAAIHRHQYS